MQTVWQDHDRLGEIAIVRPDLTSDQKPSHFAGQQGEPAVPASIRLTPAMVLAAVFRIVAEDLGYDVANVVALESDGERLTVETRLGLRRTHEHNAAVVFRGRIEAEWLPL